MINNPSTDPSAETTRVARAIWAAMQTQSANNAKNFITKMAKEETAATLQEDTDIGDFAVGVRGTNNYFFAQNHDSDIYYIDSPFDFCFYFSLSFYHCVCSSFRVWTLFYSRVRMIVPNLMSCAPTPPTAETCWSWRKDREQWSAMEEWVTVFVFFLSGTLNLHWSRGNVNLYLFFILFSIQRSLVPWKMKRSSTRTTSCFWRASFWRRQERE